MAKWRFTDPTNSTTYIFEISPNDGGTPSRKKQIFYSKTTAPDGINITMEGRDEPANGSFSGVLLSQTQFDAFNTWYEKRHQIQVTDDLNRTMTIYITGFDAKRKFSTSHPWRHTYTIDYIKVA